MLGQRRFGKNWLDSNIALLDRERSQTSELEGWDSAKNVQDQLYNWIAGGHLTSFGVDDEERISIIETKWTTTHYFQISVVNSEFLVFEDLWVPIYIDRFELEEKLALIRKLRPKAEQVFNWKVVTNQMWKIAFDLPVPRTSAALIGALQQWHIEQTDHEPDPEELRELASEILDHIGAARLSTEES